MAHRTKNDLATVSSLLRLQARGLEDKTARQALESAIMRITVIADVHQGLKQTTDIATTVDMASYVEKLSQQLGGCQTAVDVFGVCEMPQT